MSRIGNKPIPIPVGVKVKVEGIQVEIQGPKGTLQRTFHTDMKITLEDGKLLVRRPSESKFHKSLHGLTRALIANMIHGVTLGYQKVLEIEGVGYRAQKEAKGVTLLLGFSHPVLLTPPGGIELHVETPNRVVVKGVDKEGVGVFAAKIRSLRKPNPYTGKGIRYEGEWIRRKSGKTGVGVK